MSKKRKHSSTHIVGTEVTSAKPIAEAETRPDWTRNCEICGATPIVPVTGMCGPCTFGEADTIGGNW